jgi:hypothetical protein
MLVTASLFFIILIGFAALAVDVGHMMIARNELQNAADAAALAGANCLGKTPNSLGTDCTDTSSPSGDMNWAVAESKAYSSIGLNKGDGATLTDGVVTTGYKNLADSILNPSALMPISHSPVTCDLKTPGAPCYAPAVKVIIRKNTGLNNGPIQLLMNSMYGTAKIVPISVTAVAVISAPGKMRPRIPVVINKCMLDLYWNSAKGEPLLATSTTLNNVPQTIGLPWTIRIGSSYHYPNCDSGQWTSFALNSNSESVIKNLIVNGYSNFVAIGDMTWITNGTMTAAYKALDEKFPSPPGADVALIVVDSPNGLNPATGTAMPIVEFAGFHIDDIQGGSKKYIEGHFMKVTFSSGSVGIGPFHGNYTRPRLAQ